jgi:hypothetical protein
VRSVNYRSQTGSKPTRSVNWVGDQIKAGTWLQAGPEMNGPVCASSLARPLVAKPATFSRVLNGAGMLRFDRLGSAA